MMATLRRVADDFEVIVVDDGSVDDTAEVLQALRREYGPVLRVVTHDRNLGYGAALRSGFAAATKEFVFYTDGDGQYDPAEIELLLRAVTPQTGLVNGYKSERNDPWHRVAIGWLYNRLARWLFRIRLRDIDCDFRLIRRSILDPGRLRSTGGAICVELVRRLELSGAGVIELPVHHYPRRYGRSEFFRVRSLASTFLQLGALFGRLVVAPVLSGAPSPNDRFGFTPRTAAVMLLSLTALSLLAYGRALQLPLIADTYVQVQLAHDYGPVSGWSALAHDALYRCRATSLVLTYWTERAFGLDPFAFRISGLVLHILGSFLVFALGAWKPVGWKVAALAACFFAVSQRHSEAVIWYAALPELLVFVFSLASFLCWVHWLQSSSLRAVAYAGAFLFYLLALLSKESAVALVPLLVLAVVSQRGRDLRRLWGAAPFAVVAGAYFLLAFAARKTHLHFNDGTFSLHAPFLEVLIRSAGGLARVWGFTAIALLLILKARRWLALASIAGTWIALTLLPYSFLTYMPRVPSRHTYFASVGIALIIAAAALTLREWAAIHNKRWVVPVLATVLIAHQAGYLWFYKQRQYALRAEPTEALVRAGRQAPDRIYVKCFPYSLVIGEYALQYRLGGSTPPVIVTGPEAEQRPDAFDFCNEVAHP
jgi:glycosyltransferase involved in cell wall biosynthesis